MYSSFPQTESIILAYGFGDDLSPNAFDARIAAIRELFPSLATVVEVAEGIGTDPIGIRLAHTILNSALVEEACSPQSNI